MGLFPNSKCAPCGYTNTMNLLIDDTPQTTPKSEAAKPRTSSGTPSSVRGRGRPPSAKKSMSKAVFASFSISNAH